MESAFPHGELADAVEIGAVDDRSVRVWVRRPGELAVAARLAVEGRPAVEAEAQLDAATDWTGALDLALDDAAPGATFTVTAGEVERRGRLAPAPGARSALTFAFGSCNEPFTLGPDGRIRTSPAAAIYPAMAAELRRIDASFALLIGDQIYADALEPISVRDRLPGDADHPAPLDVAVEAYRRVTRGYLGQPGFRRVREALPTYCMWDDHEIFDNWGSRLTKTAQDQRLFEAAARVYGEYQHARNPGGGVGPPPFNYTLRWGDIGFFVLDVRGARDYEHGRLLGDAQWRDFQSYLTGPEAATVQTLFVVTSIPVAHVARWMAKVFDRLPSGRGDTVRDRWCSAAFVESRDALLDALFAWERGGAGRQAVLLSGDVHAAGAFSVRPRRGSGSIAQFTSSALTTQTTPTNRALSALSTRAPNLFEPRWRFERLALTFLNNYGLVRVRPLPDGGHHVSFAIRAWDRRRRRLRTAARIEATPEITERRRVRRGRRAL